DDTVIQEGEGHSPLVVGGWARLSVLLKNRGQTNNYLNSAIRLWKHATGNGTNTGNAYLLLSSLDLHEVTREAVYFDYARKSAESLLGQQVKSGRLEGAFGNYGEVTAAGLASF